MHWVVGQQHLRPATQSMHVRLAAELPPLAHTGVCPACYIRLLLATTAQLDLTPLAALTNSCMPCRINTAGLVEPR